MATAAGTSVRADLETLFGAAISAAFPDLTDAAPMIAACNNTANGDYQCNNAMPLFGKLKGKEGAPKSPRDVALAIVNALPQNGVLSNTSLAGPGFINCRLSAGYLSERINAMLERGMGIWAPPLPVSASSSCLFRGADCGTVRAADACGGMHVRGMTGARAEQ